MVAIWWPNGILKEPANYANHFTTVVVVEMITDLILGMNVNKIVPTLFPLKLNSCIR